jgi:hypothetical protein
MIAKYGVHEDTRDSLEVCAVRRRSLHSSIGGGEPKERGLRSVGASNVAHQPAALPFTRSPCANP